MLKKINRILKLVGFNLVRAKRKKVTTRPGIRYDETKYMGETEWQNTPPVAVAVSTPCTGISDSGHTHFVGDDCPGGHRVGTENICIGPEAKVHVVDPNANFVPVDIGVNDHEITKSTK